MPGIAVVGCGGWGRNWVREAGSQGVLRWICDASDKTLSTVEPSLSIRRTTRLDEMLADPDVQGVVVATPAETHAAVAVKVLQAGKHVLVEKPMGTTLEEAQRIAAAHKGTGLVGMVGHLMLYHAAIQWIRDFITRGELGELYYMTARRLNLGVVRQKENAIWSFAPHDLAVALHIFGETPTKVQAMGSCFLQRKIGVADVGFLHLTFPSGRMFHGHFSWLDPAKRREMIFVGSKKMIVFDDAETKDPLKVYDKGAFTPETGHPILRDAFAPQIFSGDVMVPALPKDSALANELRAFLTAMGGDDSANLSPFTQGLAVTQILESAITLS